MGSFEKNTPLWRRFFVNVVTNKGLAQIPNSRIKALKLSLARGTFATLGKCASDEIVAHQRFGKLLASDEKFRNLLLQAKPQNGADLAKAMQCQYPDFFTSMFERKHRRWICSSATRSRYFQECPEYLFNWWRNATVAEEVHLRMEHHVDDDWSWWDTLLARHLQHKGTVHF